MEKFQVSTVNSRFAVDTEVEAPDMAQATDAAVAGAVSIAADEVRDGAMAASVDVCVARVGAPAVRCVVTLSVTSLLT